MILVIRKRTLLYFLFFLNSYIYAQKIDFNPKKEYGREQLSYSSIDSFFDSSTQLLIDINPEDISVLVKSEKIEILKRIDQYHYVVKTIGDLNLETFRNARYISLTNDEWKLSTRIRNRVKLIGSPLKLAVVGLKESVLRSYLLENGLTSYELLYAYHKTVGIQSDDIEIINLLKINNRITHIDFITEGVREEAMMSDHDLTYNKVNKVHSDFPDLNGNGLTVSIKEDAFFDSDIDLLGRTIISGIESNTVSSHATDMATIIGGAGNSFITGKGSAWATTFTSSSFENIFPDNDAVFTDLGISVQNHSYGTAIIDNRYGAEAMSYDVSTNANTRLLHVFSSGNIGFDVADEGIYKDVQHYANLSGNFKMAKNILLVGAVDELGNVDERNSVGPAYDGRLKPELVAYGKNGTSESSAMVSGISLLLQQRYLEKYGMLPTSSLLKAALIAGADDVGASGIDFITGYGNVNASHSIDIIDKGNYYNNVITDGKEVTFNITVPTNVHEVKIALVWNDPAANPEDNKALINDLDLKVSNTLTNEVWLPWVLDYSPNATLLANPAVRKEDHLNNVEYITINFPSSGTYTVSITGNNILSTSQLFDVAYTWNYIDQFVWTYPSANDVIIADDSTTIQWEGTVTGNTNVEIQINNGAWTTALENIDLTAGIVNWKAIAASTMAKLRVNINGVFVTSEVFVIAPLVDYSVGFNCEDKFMLQWNAVAGVDGYNVYQLGDKYLELVNQTTDTMMVFPKDNFDQLYYTISPVWSGKEGNTNLAYNYENQGVNCYYRNFLARNEGNESVRLELNISSIYNVKELIFEKREEHGNYSLVTSIVPETKRLQYVVDDTNPILNFSFYRAKIVLNDDSEIILDEVEVFFPNLNTMLVYPNPILQHDYFTLLSKGDGGILEMIDLTGTVVRQWDIRSNVASYFLPNIQKGMYILQIVRGTKVYGRERIVVY